MSLFDQAHRLGPHQWLGLFWMVLGLAVLVRLSWFRLTYRRKLGIAVDWPKAEGSVWSGRVVETRNPEVNAQDCDVVFTYSFSLNVDGRLKYFSGESGRRFKNVDSAREWLKLLEGKTIPVRFQPGKPDVSAVLDEDIDMLEREPSVPAIAVSPS